MPLNCGIVGLPNVGKSTIFNALTQSQGAEAANYPFCTIDPNSGMVTVPDARLWELQKITGTNKVIPIQLELVDIAGLVKGAAEGAGKGNAFLGHIKSVDAILHVVRCFEDDDIIHVDGSIDPVRDIETIDLELLLKDVETMTAKRDRCRKRRSDKESQAAADVLDKAIALADEGKPVRAMGLSDAEMEHLKECQLITAKPMLFVCNVADDELPNGNTFSAQVQAHAEACGAAAIIISGKIEEELSALDDDERQMFMDDLGIQEPGLHSLVKAGYALLKLQTYFTAGEKEVRAWQIKQGFKAPQAAGVIHTDFEAGFIRAEVAAYDDYVSLQGEKGCREAGKLRAEGKVYEVQDGDVMHFLFNK
jgi:GTP-binding protein YchF